MSSRTLRLASGVSLVLITCFLQSVPAAAQTTRVVLRDKTLQSGYTVRVPEGTFLIGIPGGSITTVSQAVIKLHKVEHPENFSLTGETLIGDLYSYHLQSDAPVQLQRRLWLQLSYPSNQKRTLIKYWNTKRQHWVKLKTRHNTDSLQAFAQLKRSSAVVGVFAKHVMASDNVVEGTASWYNGTVAASNAFPMGSTIRVTNPATGQSVETIVGSTWSGDTKYGWLLDLPKDAFASIANISSGLVQVTVEVVSNQ